jgi:hypothetical protein
VPKAADRAPKAAPAGRDALKGSILENESHHQEQRKAEQEGQKVHDVEPGVFFMLDLGNKVGSSDVDEVAGGERKKKSYVEVE